MYVLSKKVLLLLIITGTKVQSFLVLIVLYLDVGDLGWATIDIAQYAPRDPVENRIFIVGNEHLLQVILFFDRKETLEVELLV